MQSLHRGKDWSPALCKLAAIVGVSACLDERQYQRKLRTIISHGGKSIKIIWEGICDAIASVCTGNKQEIPQEILHVRIQKTSGAHKKYFHFHVRQGS